MKWVFHCKYRNPLPLERSLKNFSYCRWLPWLLCFIFLIYYKLSSIPSPPFLLQISAPSLALSIIFSSGFYILVLCQIYQQWLPSRFHALRTLWLLALDPMLQTHILSPPFLLLLVLPIFLDFRLVLACYFFFLTVMVGKYPGFICMCLVFYSCILFKLDLIVSLWQYWTEDRFFDFLLLKFYVYSLNLVVFMDTNFYIGLVTVKHSNPV